jgi:hypothetical protein
MTVFDTKVIIVGHLCCPYGWKPAPNKVNAIYPMVEVCALQGIGEFDAQFIVDSLKKKSLKIALTDIKILLRCYYKHSRGCRCDYTAHFLVILPQALMRLLLLVCELYSCFDALVIAT